MNSTPANSAETSVRPDRRLVPRSILPAEPDVSAPAQSLWGERIADIEIALQPDGFWTVTDDRPAMAVMEDIERISFDNAPTYTPSAEAPGAAAPSQAMGDIVEELAKSASPDDGVSELDWMLDAEPAGDGSTDGGFAGKSAEDLEPGGDASEPSEPPFTGDAGYLLELLDRQPSLSVGAAETSFHADPSATAAPSRSSWSPMFYPLGIVIGGSILFAVARYVVSEDGVSLLDKIFTPMVTGATAAMKRQSAKLLRFAAFGPNVSSAGETFVVQAVLHSAGDEVAAETLAKQADPGAVRRAVKTLSVPVEKGDLLDVDIEVIGGEADIPRESIIWQGEPTAASFWVTLHDECRFPAKIKLTLSRDSVPVGTVRFVVGDARIEASRHFAARGDDAIRYKRAFVSYASEDRVDVLKRVEPLEYVGIEVFQDILSLDPGDRWERRLYTEIDRSDLFLLFWSDAAKASSWVLRETEYALDRNEESGRVRPDIKPIPLGGPPIPDVPKRLQGLHFNSKMNYLIAGAEVEAAKIEAEKAHAKKG